MQDRVEDAKKVVRKIHHLETHHNDHFAMVEFYQMQKQAEYDRNLTPSYWQMFKRPSYRKRMLMTFGLSWLAQSTGVLGTCIDMLGWFLLGSLFQ